MTTPRNVQLLTVAALLGERGVAALAGEELSIFGGDTVRVTVTVEYRGPAISDQLYGAIGERGLFFDEVWAGTGSLVNFAQSVDWETYTLTVDIVTGAGYPHPDYDLMVKLLGHPSIYQELYDCINVVGRAEFQNFSIDSYEKV